MWFILLIINICSLNYIFQDIYFREFNEKRSEYIAQTQNTYCLLPIVPIGSFSQDSLSSLEQIACYIGSVGKKNQRRRRRKDLILSKYNPRPPQQPPPISRNSHDRHFEIIIELKKFTISSFKIPSYKNKFKQMFKKIGQVKLQISFFCIPSNFYFLPVALSMKVKSKHISVGLSDCRPCGLSEYRTAGLQLPSRLGPVFVIYTEQTNSCILK